MAKNDSLGDRMKGYEDVWRQYLPNRMPVIIRVDGKGFHSFTKNCVKPFDQNILEAMTNVACCLLRDIDGAVMAYRQSDEVSVLINNYQTLNQEPYFSNNLQKIVSVSASIATNSFNKYWFAGKCVLPMDGDMKFANFDARAFVIPREEVANYFLWRQQDAIRNAIQMFARAKMSHNECQGKSCRDLLGIFAADSAKKEAGLISSNHLTWSDVSNSNKFGTFVFKNSEMPLQHFLIKDNRNIIEELIL